MWQARQDEEAYLLSLGIADAALRLARDRFGKGRCISRRLIDKRAF